MTAAGTFPTKWREVCQIGIITQGSASAVEFGAFTNDITGMDWGEKESEGEPLVNGGRNEKWTPMGDESITLKCFPVKADSGTTQSVIQLFHPQSTADSTQPISVLNTLTRNKYGIILQWAETLPANSQTIPAESKAAYRIQVINAEMTKCKPDYSDKELSYEIAFKWRPFNISAVSNKKEESTDGSAQLPAAITSATTAF